MLTQRLLQGLAAEGHAHRHVQALGQWLSMHTAHPAAAALCQAVAELAWLVGPPASADAATIERLLDGLAGAIDLADQGLQARCADVRAMVVACVKTRLGQACRQDLQCGQPYGQAWVSACAELLLTAEGAVDDTLFPAVKELLAQGGAGWLPPDWQAEARLRLRQWMNPDLKLPQQVDRLSCTSPLHPQFDRLRRLQFVDSERPVRHQLATLLLMFHFTTPRQPQGMGVCWLVAPNAHQHLNQPEHLMQGCKLWFEQGLIEVPGPPRQTDCVAPSLYSVHALQWVARALPQGELVNSPVSAQLLRALRCVQPAASEGDWIELLRFMAHRLRQAHHPPTVLQLLRAVLMAHLNATQGWALSESRLARPPQRQSPVLRERVARFESQLQDCLAVIESQTLNLVTACWQLSLSRHVAKGKLQACWDVLEPLLIDSLDLQSLPGDVEDYLAELWSMFIACGDLRYERDAKSGQTGFRLHFKVPGAPGRGTPVGNVQQLLEWIACFSRELVKRSPRSAFAHQHAALLKRIARVNKEALASALSTGGAPLREEDDSKGGAHLREKDDLVGGIWFLEVGAHYLAAEPPLDLPSGVRSDDFVELYLSLSSLRWNVLAVVDVWVEPRTSLVNLLRMMRSAQALAGSDLQLALDSMNGRILMYLPHNADGEGAHMMTLLARREPLRSLYTDAGPLDEAIERVLVEPMREALRQRLSVDAARAWLMSVLKACVLKDGADLDMAVQQALDLAMKRGSEEQRDCSLKRLVKALRVLQGDAAASPLFTTDPRSNGLSVAVLNGLPFEVVALAYGDPNWEGERLVLFCFDPIQRDIGHFSANDGLMPSGEPRLHFVAARPSFLF